MQTFAEHQATLDDFFLEQEVSIEASPDPDSMTFVHPLLWEWAEGHGDTLSYQLVAGRGQATRFKNGMRPVLEADVKEPFQVYGPGVEGHEEGESILDSEGDRLPSVLYLELPNGLFSEAGEITVQDCILCRQNTAIRQQVQSAFYKDPKKQQRDSFQAIATELEKATEGDWTGSVTGL